MKNMKKFKLLGQPVEKMSIPNNLEDIQNLFKKYLELLCSSFQDLNPEEVD